MASLVARDLAVSLTRLSALLSQLATTPLTLPVSPGMLPRMVPSSVVLFSEGGDLPSLLPVEAQYKLSPPTELPSLLSLSNLSLGD